MDTVVIRIEGPDQDGRHHVRGLRLGADDEPISDEPLGALPFPLPAVRVDGIDRPAAAALSETMLAAGDPGLRPADAGRYLWNLLSGTRATDWWQAVEAGGPLRTLLDIRSPELRSLPWELMTRSPDGHRPFGSPRSSWARGEAQADRCGELRVPVRMLVVVGDPQDSRLRVDDEIDAIMGALSSMTGRWHVEVMVKPEYSDLNERLATLNPDVLHVITHGKTGEDGTVLVFPVDEDNAWELTAADVANLAGRPPRLVVLNACRSKHDGLAGPSGPGATWGFTDAFLGWGARAVITMQGNIVSDAAIPFSRVLYESLADHGDPLQVACAKARQAIYGATRTSSDDRSWAMPSLHLRGRCDRMLQAAVPAGGNPLQDPRYRALFRRVPDYVDRGPERRELLSYLDPAGAGPESPVYLVEGPKNVGKSAVAQSALLSYHLRGWRVVYLDAGAVRRTSRRPLGDAWGDEQDDQFGAGWIDLLRDLRDELRRCLPGTDPHARHFDDRLTRYKTAGVGCPLPPYDPEQALPDDVAENFNDGRENYRQAIQGVLTEFCVMLAGIAGDEPLLIALDHLHAMESHDLTDYIVPFLVDSLGRADMANVHVVLIDRPNKMDTLRTRSTLNLPKPLEISNFGAREIRRLGGDYCAKNEWLPVSPKIQQLLKLLSSDSYAKEFDGMYIQSIFRLIRENIPAG